MESKGWYKRRGRVGKQQDNVDEVAARDKRSSRVAVVFIPVAALAAPRSTRVGSNEPRRSGWKQARRRERRRRNRKKSGSTSVVASDERCVIYLLG